MAEAAQSAGELPVKRQRGEEEAANGGASAGMEVNNGAAMELPESMSSVIPGWFSEMSSMWPGEFVVRLCGGCVLMAADSCGVCDYLFGFVYSLLCYWDKCIEISSEFAIAQAYFHLCSGFLLLEGGVVCGFELSFSFGF